MQPDDYARLCWYQSKKKLTLDSGLPQKPFPIDRRDVNEIAAEAKRHRESESRKRCVPHAKEMTEASKPTTRSRCFADRRKPDAHPASAIPTKFTEEGSMARTLSIWVYTVMPPAKRNRKRSLLLPSKTAYPVHTYTHTHTHIYIHTQGFFRNKFQAGANQCFQNWGGREGWA